MREDDDGYKGVENEFPTYKYIMRKGGFSDKEAPELLKKLIEEIRSAEHKR
jgi:hypothetical protein